MLHACKNVASCALCAALLDVLHVLQGMAMGAQANIVDSVHIFIAIAAHKGLAAYALGSSIVDSQVSDPYSSLIAPALPLMFTAQQCDTSWISLPHLSVSRQCVQ